MAVKIRCCRKAGGKTKDRCPANPFLSLLVKNHPAQLSALGYLEGDAAPIQG